MGEFREHRSIIPGALLVFIFGLTILVATYPNVVFWQSLTKDTAIALVAIISLFISTLAGGYLCGTLTISLFGTFLVRYSVSPRGSSGERVWIVWSATPSKSKSR